MKRLLVCAILTLLSSPALAGWPQFHRVRSWPQFSQVSVTKEIKKEKTVEAPPVPEEDTCSDGSCGTRSTRLLPRFRVQNK
jgi:hypothetical protein